MSTGALSLEFAQRVCGYHLDRDDAALVGAARTAIIDTVAVTLLGADAPATRIARAALQDLAPGPCTVFGAGVPAGVLDAAYVNGVASHAMDFDDFTQEFGGHPSVPIVPGALALAEQREASGAALIEAYVAGVELETRIAAGVHFHHYEKGWHPTSTLGVFGAAAAASRLMGLSVPATATALAIAASLSSGLKANFGTMTKPLHVGHAARAGVQAALLAANGFEASLDAFEHHQGFLEVYNGAGNYRVEAMLEDWFAPSVIVSPGISLKQFACCGSTHPAIYMALELRQGGLAPEDIEELWIGTHPRRLPHTDNPHPGSGLEAKFSIQYCVARALVSGPPRVSHFEDDALEDSAVRALMQRVRVGVHPQMTDPAAPSFGAEVVATTAGGTRRARVEHLPGRGAINPMSERELYEKFSDCAASQLSAHDIDALWSALAALEGLSSLAALPGLAATRQVQDTSRAARA